MPIPPEIIGPIAQSGGDLINSGLSGINVRASRKWQEKMYKKQRADAIADVQAQNAYNSPAAQMARYKDAGLNPNLIYGQSNEGATYRSSSVPGGQSSEAKINVGGAISTYQDMKLKDAQIDLMKTQQLINFAESVLKGAQTANVQQQTKTGEFELGLKTDLREISVDAAKAALRKTLADTQFTLDQNERANVMFSPHFAKALLDAAGQAIQNAKSSEEIKEIRERVRNIIADTRMKNADAKLKENGIQPHDSALARWIQSLFTGGLKDPAAVKRAFDNLEKNGVPW